MALREYLRSPFFLAAPGATAAVPRAAAAVAPVAASFPTAPALSVPKVDIIEPEKASLLISAAATMAGAAAAAPQLGVTTSASALLGLSASGCVGIGGLLAAAPLISFFGRPAAPLPLSGSLRGRGGNIKMQAEAAEGVPGTPEPPKFDVKTMPGITSPLGFFDPMGFCEDASEGKIRFYREVELKHGRVAMLASLGFLAAEQFHPLFGGNIDVPSYIAFQQTPLQTFWPAVVTVIAVLEVFSVFSFNSPFGGEPWSIRPDYAAGDLGFDPLGLKPEDAAGLAEMQTKELNNGRLAMFAIAGMVAQELASGQKLF